MLSAYFHHYYPSFATDRQLALKGLVDRVAEAKFGSAYDSSRGVVVADRTTQIVKPQLRVSKKRTNRAPEIRFFQKTNPNSRNGDELVCMTSCSRDNLKPYSKKIFETYLGTTVYQEMLNQFSPNYLHSKIYL